MLILAGITIVYVFGDNSIFKLAQDAKDKTDQAKKDEQDYLSGIDDIINQYTIPPIGPDKKGEIQTADKTVYKDETGTAIIPGGFCVVKDSPTDETDKNTVASGLVISDKANDDLDNTDGETKGNQFVWIPVPDYSKFHLIEGYDEEGGLQNYLSGDKPTQEAGDSSESGSPGKPNTANSAAGTPESIAMYKSVKNNGGFFIARFEAGEPGTNDGTMPPLSQRGVDVWDEVSWIDKQNIGSVDSSGGASGSKLGAVSLARSMYANDEIHNVRSTLCYGVQWDAALNFIDPNYESGKSVGFAANSGEFGYYPAYSSSEIAVTGSSVTYQKNHIYDMAGNVPEWTMETAYNSSNAILRGGRQWSYGDKKVPASCREADTVGSTQHTPPAYYSSTYGFRVTLYIQ